jgi:hypothetical protein
MLLDFTPLAKAVGRLGKARTAIVPIRTTASSATV